MSVGEKLIASNPSRGDYFVEEVVEAGIAFQGTEVKSIRKTAPNLKDAYVDVQSGSQKRLEAFLMNAHISPYSHGNIFNHEPDRKRKLLLHRHQIERLYGAVIREGMTIIPLRMYFKSGKIKVELGVCKGKKKYDKREDLKKKSADREMDRAMKHSSRKR
jgi:SsrA-binding protein